MTFVMRMPVWKLFAERCWAKFRICLIPTEVSGRNSTQMVPISALGGFGLLAVGGLAYFFIIASLGLAEKVMSFRL